MTLTKAKLNRLETKLNKRSNKDENSFQCPERWEDFARLCDIRSGGDIVKFNPYKYQIDLVHEMLERSVLCVKARQLGVSETVTNFMLWKACLNPGYLGLIFSKTQQDSSLLARRVKRFIESLGLRTRTDNTLDIELSSGGRLMFRSSSENAGRGIESVCDALIDEAGFLDTAQEIYNALAPSQQLVGAKARIFIISTPNGRQGFYHQLATSGNGDRDIETICNQVSKGDLEPYQSWVDEGGWSKVICHWSVHPVYGNDPNFLTDLAIKKKLSQATIDREYQLNFTESESNFFSVDVIRNCATGVNESSVNDAFYFAGIDASTVGQDYAVCAVIKYADDVFSLVNVYRKRQQATDYHLFYMSKLIEEYDPAMVGIEVTGGTGQVWFEQLSKSHFGTKFKAINTTGDSKPAMLDRFKLMLETEKFIFPSNSPLLDELLNFKRDGKKLEASAGKHDDVIMACAFALTAAEIWL